MHVYFVSNIAYRKLQELNLPNSLELLDRPMALPPSVLAKSAEVRADSGPMRIRQLLEDLDILCTQDRNLLNEVGHATCSRTSC